MFQPTLSDLGQPLRETTFVVVDLETTGGSPQTDRITEIGAVKIRGGEVLGELSTLVDPGVAVPASITALTGISTQLVSGRPPIAAVLPSWVEFAAGSCLVAHNARFDVAFLDAALARLDYPPLDHPVVCTAQLARRLVGDEVRNRKLGTLARHFRSSTVPVHRALADARATVDVLHGLLEGAGGFGVVTLDDLIAFSRVRNAPLFASRRKMADDLPRSPGVYRFLSPAGEVLYVGKATDLRARVRQYFGGDTRRRVGALVAESARVDHTPTPTAVEAEVLEARLIREHRPRFNARGKRVAAPVWVVLSGGAWPRLSITRKPPAAGRAGLGPLPTRRVAQQVVDAIHDALPIRRCTTPMRADTRFAACALAEMGRCLAPCLGEPTPERYGDVVEAAEVVLGGNASGALAVLQDRMAARAAEGRYEDAAELRDRIAALVTWTTRVRRDAALRGAGLLAASRPAGPVRRGPAPAASAAPAGAAAAVTAREVLVQQAGWLLGTAVVPDAAAVPAAVASIRDAADPVPPTPPPPDEVAILQRWLGAPGVRIEHADQPLAWPVGGGRAGAAVQRRLDRARRGPGRHAAEKVLARAREPR